MAQVKENIKAIEFGPLQKEQMIQIEKILNDIDKSGVGLEIWIQAVLEINLIGPIWLDQRFHLIGCQTLPEKHPNFSPSRGQI